MIASTLANAILESGESEKNDYRNRPIGTHKYLCVRPFFRGPLALRWPPKENLRVLNNRRDSTLQPLPADTNLRAPGVHPRGARVAQHAVKTSWWSELIASAVAVSGVGYVAASYTISRWLTRAVQASHPSLLTKRHDVGSAGMPDRGRPASGWMGVDTSGYTRHGGSLSRSAQPRPAPRRIDFLTREGYRCVAFDHRAHGQSEGKRTSFGYHERQDVSAVLELIARRWPDQPRGILGISMGAAAVCYAAPHTHTSQAVILESMYHNLARASAAGSVAAFRAGSVASAQA